MRATLVNIEELMDENARLKAELRKRALDSLSDIGQLGEQSAEIAQLKDEVEAHEKRWTESEDLIWHYKQQRDEAINDCECSRLKAEVERLTKENETITKDRDLMFQEIKEGREAYQRLHHLYLTAKGVQS